MTHARQSLGKHGEDLACRELRRRGYAIVARRYRTRFGEIDVIVRHLSSSSIADGRADDLPLDDLLDVAGHAHVEDDDG